MKCIKLLDGQIDRVPDWDAANKVKEGVAVYCTKSAWKASRHAIVSKQVEVAEQVKSRLQRVSGKTPQSKPKKSKVEIAVANKRKKSS